MALQSENEMISLNDAPQNADVIPPIHTIPPELVGEIFAKSLEDSMQPISQSAPSVTMRSEVSPFTLSHVCKRWRDLALSMSTLWSSIAIYEPKMGHIPLVDLWLRRAGDLPLALCLLQSGNRKNTHHESTEQVLSLFVQYVARWKTIIFHLETPQSPLLNIPHGGAKMLDSATVMSYFWNPRGENSYIDQVWDILYSSSTLRRASWGRGYMPNEAPWTQLTHIDIDTFILDRAALELLQLCQNIEALTLMQLSIPSISMVDVPLVTPAHLRILSVFCDSDPGPMFQRLELPALECLDVRHLYYHEAPPASPVDLKDLLVRSSCRLKKFIFVDQDAEECKVLDYLRLPSLQGITELHLSAGVEDMTIKALTIQMDTLVPHILPQLEILILKASRTSDKVLSKMIASRLSRLRVFATAMHVDKDSCVYDRAFFETLNGSGCEIYFTVIPLPVAA